MGLTYGIILIGFLYNNKKVETTNDVPGMYVPAIFREEVSSCSCCFHIKKTFFLPDTNKSIHPCVRPVRDTSSVVTRL